MTLPDRPRFLTVAEFDAAFPTSAAGVYREIHAGRLACIKIGGKYIVPSRALAVLEARAAGEALPEFLVEASTSPTGRPFLGIPQAATLLRISVTVLAREAREGRFPAVEFGGKRIVACRAIDDLEREALESMSLVDAAEFTSMSRLRAEVA